MGWHCVFCWIANLPEQIGWLANPIHSSQVLMAGLRDLDATEKEFIAQNSIPVFTDKIVWKQQSLNQLAKRNTRYLYILLDLDGPAPDIFPAVQCPSSQWIQSPIHRRIYSTGYP